MKEDSIKFTLSKKERLHKKLEIEYLFSKGRKHTSFPISIIYCKSLSKEDTKVIFLASKRTFPKAHQRNKAKRVLREVYRLNKHQIPENIFIGVSILNKKFSYPLIEDSFQKAIQNIS
jgi:ribonuclease P protein component